MKLKELLPLLDYNYDVYYKGQWFGVTYDNTSYRKGDISEWVLECRIVEIEIEENPILVSIYTRE